MSIQHLLLDLADSLRCSVTSIVLFLGSPLHIKQSFALHINTRFEYDLMVSNAYPEF